MECWQWGQLDLGRVMDCPRGIRWMQTFKKLPIANPKAITNPSISMVKVYLERPRLWRGGLWSAVSGYRAPRALNTAGMVLNMIRMSSQNDQVSMYSRSNSIHLLKSMSFRPETCQRQVIPGFTLNRRLCLVV